MGSPDLWCFWGVLGLHTEGLGILEHFPVDESRTSSPSLETCSFALFMFDRIARRIGEPTCEVLRFDWTC